MVTDLQYDEGEKRMQVLTAQCAGPCQAPCQVRLGQLLQAALLALPHLAAQAVEQLCHLPMVPPHRILHRTVLSHHTSKTQLLDLLYPWGQAGTRSLDSRGSMPIPTSKGVRPNRSMGLGSHCAFLSRYSTTE